jgi:hypothetical protein
MLIAGIAMGDATILNIKKLVVSHGFSTAGVTPMQAV